MIGYGVTYKDDCNNGATDFMVTGGAITLAANLIPVVYHVSVIFALCDGNISKAETAGLQLLELIMNILPLVNIGVAIWVKHFSIMFSINVPRVLL